MRVEYLAGAEADAQAAWNHFEEISANLADAFHAAVVTCERQLAQFPQSGSAYFKEYRRLIVPKFNYALIYRVYSTRILVSALVSLYLPREEVLRRLNH